MFKLHLYWFSLNRKDNKENYGDVLGPFIVSKLSKRKIVSIPYLNSRKYNFLYKQYFTIGSIIKRVTKNSIVWGSGIINADEQVKKATFLAVRGPRTRNRLLDLGYSVPEKYGDPALLLPKFISNTKNKKYILGIIPHIVDYKELKETFQHDDTVRIINLITDDVERTTNEILECEHIISSSLHGVIVSHAYNIPALWVKFSNKLSGDNVKFYDYFESVGIDYNKELSVNLKETNTEELLHLLIENKKNSLPKSNLLNLRLKQLLETCPF